MFESELWKEIPGYGHHYEASNLGRIRAKDRLVTKKSNVGNEIHQFYRQRILKPIDRSGDGYLSVRIGVDGKKINLSIHRAVLLAFIGYPNAGQEACHNNGNQSDNRIENLRWDTHKANNQDRILHNTYARGASHHFAKFSEMQVLAIRSGALGRKDAIASGISPTQYHRIKAGESWAQL